MLYFVKKNNSVAIAFRHFPYIARYLLTENNNTEQLNQSSFPEIHIKMTTLAFLYNFLLKFI